MAKQPPDASADKGKMSPEERTAVYRRRDRVNRLTAKRDAYTVERDEKIEIRRGKIAGDAHCSGWTPEDLQEKIDDIDIEIERLAALGLETEEMKRGTDRKSRDSDRDNTLDGESDETKKRIEGKMRRFARRRNKELAGAPESVLNDSMAYDISWWRLKSELRKLHLERSAIKTAERYYGKSCDDARDELKANAEAQAEVHQNLTELDAAQPERAYAHDDGYLSDFGPANRLQKYLAEIREAMVRVKTEKRRKKRRLKRLEKGREKGL